MDNNKIGIAILVGLGILGFLFFMTRKTGPLLPSLAPSGNGYVGAPLRLMPAGSLNREAGLLHYRNKETRNIEWSDEGLPSKIVIEREYYQLP